MINEILIKELGLISPERIAQWVIDNRYGNGKESISNHELYHILVDAIKLYSK